jgi:hypothetical protein
MQVALQLQLLCHGSFSKSWHSFGSAWRLTPWSRAPLQKPLSLICSWNCQFLRHPDVENTSPTVPHYISLRTDLILSSQFVDIQIHLEQVKSFKYLGSIVNGNNSIEEEIKERISLGNKTYHDNQDLFKSKLLTKKSKLWMHQTLVRPAVTCALKRGC